MKTVTRTARTQIKREQEDEDRECSSLSPLSRSPPPFPATKPRIKCAKHTTDAGPLVSAEGTTWKKPKRTARKPKINPTSLEGVDEDVVDTAGYLPRPVQDNEKGGWKVGAHASAAGGVENAPVNAAEIGYVLSLVPLFSSVCAVRFQRHPSPGGHILSDNFAPSFSPPSPFLRTNAERSSSNSTSIPQPTFLYMATTSSISGTRHLQTQVRVRMRPRRNSAVWTARRHAAEHPCINEAHRAMTAGAGGDAVVVLEDVAGSGNVIRSNFEEIALNIEGVDDKTPVGVCFDTCHGFSASYDFRTKAGWDSWLLLRKFDELIGVKYVKGMHLDDSKTEFGFKTDWHESIAMYVLLLLSSPMPLSSRPPSFFSIDDSPILCRSCWGSLSLASSHQILSNAHSTKGIPLVLETPSWECRKEIWGTEIEALGKLIGLPVLTEAKTVDGKLVAEEKDALAAIKRIGGEQTKVKRGKGKVDGDSKTKVKATKRKKGGAEKKRKRRLGDEGEEQGDNARRCQRS
ncbi:xylose isomerase-like protein [Coprinopsis sp. MPI-PUGE-AT-0042]|nr:xylose isomerase-like protein [Coprinopsis sp. MPI-PUGE-AT-0042]